MQLITALRYNQPLAIAFVGAGGKSTAIFTVAKQLLTAGGHVPSLKTVLVTTSTHFGAWQADQADHHFCIDNERNIRNLRNDLPGGTVLLTGKREGNLLEGLNQRLLEELHRLAESQHLPMLIEADGSHMHPIKAPAEHEPEIPGLSQAVVVTVGMQALGKPVSPEWVHRPELFCELSGLRPGQEITAEAMVKALLSQDGGLKNIPRSARRIALLNQADTPELQGKAGRIAEMLIPTYQAGIVSSLAPVSGRAQPISNEAEPGDDAVHAVVEPVCGIILAAGGSSRFGQPKQILTWRGEPLIKHVAKTALRAGLNPVIVVLGDAMLDIVPILKDLDVRIVNNERWMEGVSTSIRTGLAGLREEVGSAVFLQADQPQIPSQLVKSLVEAHRSTLSPIIAPQIGGMRGNPVLFDRETFPALAGLDGDRGGRALFSYYPIQWVTWHDPKVLIDIDSPEDYWKFLEAFPETEGAV